MQELINFFKEIFMLKQDDGMKVGLSQFKVQDPVSKPRKLVLKSAKEIKISDLMRRAS